MSQSRYKFVRVSEFLASYVEKYPKAADNLWLENLTEAINRTQYDVVSVGYDSMGEPMTLCLRVN